jgi:hypothetical protein
MLDFRCFAHVGEEETPTDAGFNLDARPSSPDNPISINAAFIHRRILSRSSQASYAPVLRSEKFSTLTS